MNTKIGILYICTGKYKIFWQDFYLSCEKNFIPEAEKHYFVFTDSPEIEFESDNKNIHRIYQENLGWPNNTLKRYEIFLKSQEKLVGMNYIFYLNANLLFLEKITAEEFLPQNQEKLVGCLHPGYYDKPVKKFNYEDNPLSTAFVDKKDGKFYFAGGINGGKTVNFLEAIKTLSQNIEKDEQVKIIAKWHDESHWNRYLNEHLAEVKILTPAYLFPEDSDIDFPKKILVRDKRGLGGHFKLRGRLEIRLALGKIYRSVIRNYLKISDLITTTSISLAIFSSFFILRNFHLGSIKLPQLFYLFLFIALINTSLKVLFLAEHKEILKKILQKYARLMILFFIFIIPNLIFYFINYQTSDLPIFFLPDLGRVIAEIILAILIIIHLTINKQAYVWLMTAFFVPLTLTPLLFFRDIDKLMTDLPDQFFSLYSLQALQYNTTSLATWLIVAFAFSISFLFRKIQDKKILTSCLFGLSTIIITSLIWWTNSRGALVGILLISLVVSFIFYWKQKIKLLCAFIVLLLMFIISLNILPPQAKTSIFVRYYPQYRQEAIKSNFKVESVKELVTKTEVKPQIIPTVTQKPTNDVVVTVKVEEKITPKGPSLLADQDRQNFWPKHILYVLNHPLGAYGPKFLSLPNEVEFREGEHNTILQAGKWGGLGALIIILLILFYISKLSINLIKKYGDSPYVIGLTMAFLGTLILMMLNSFIQLKTFWILIAMIIAYSWQKESEIKTILTSKISDQK